MGGDYGDGGPIKRKRELLEKMIQKLEAALPELAMHLKSGKWLSPIQAYDKQCQEREDAHCPNANNISTDV